jgi:hypothetical protein
VGLDRARLRLVEEGHADGDAQARLGVQAGEHVEIAFDERALGDDADGVAEVGAGLEAAPRQLVRGLERLVAVGHAAEEDRFAPPRGRRERLAQERGRLGLDHELRLEVGARAQAEVLVAGAGVAVGAGVEAAPVRVDAPAEADVGAFVLGQNRAAAIFVDLGHRRRRLAQVLDARREPGVGRVLGRG